MPYTAIERNQASHASYDATSKRFLLHSVPKDYSNQFSHLYNQRLVRMRNILREKSHEVWGEDVKVLDKIIDSEANAEEEVESTAEYVIIGTIYKEMSFRSSVLDEFKDMTDVKVANIGDNFSSSSDTLLLEDESGRIVLSGVLGDSAHLLVTGVCVAIKGRESTLGTFQTTDWIFVNGKSMEMSPTLSKSMVTLKSSYSSSSQSIESIVSSNPSYLLFVSDLRVGGNPATDAPEVALARQLLVDFISGRLGGPSERALASKITRVIVAGNSVAPTTPVSTRDRFASTKAQQHDLGAPTTQLDLLLVQLLGNCAVDIMPGKLDPTNVSLPQQPLHPCLFKHSSRFDSLNLVPSPYEFSIEGCAVLGHSGQPTDDILRQTRNTAVSDDVTANNKMVVDNVIDGTKQSVGQDSIDALNALRKTLVWGHICPTAPDTLPCHPFTDDDPFIIAPTKKPRIYFSSCQKSFSTCMEQGTRLFCVPSFHLTQQVVLVDVHSLDYQVLEFNV